MTLDEAIVHYEAKAKTNREISESPFINDFGKGICREYAEEYEQVVGWLKELKAYRELFESPEEAKRTLEQLMV